MTVGSSCMEHWRIKWPIMHLISSLSSLQPPANTYKSSIRRQPSIILRPMVRWNDWTKWFSSGSAIMWPNTEPIGICFCSHWSMLTAQMRFIHCEWICSVLCCLTNRWVLSWPIWSFHERSALAHIRAYFDTIKTPVIWLRILRKLATRRTHTDQTLESTQWHYQRYFQKLARITSTFLQRLYEFFYRTPDQLTPAAHLAHELRSKLRSYCWKPLSLSEYVDHFNFHHHLRTWHP